MGYRLRPKERVDSGVRRVIREQIRGAVQDLSRTGAARHEGVHEARKRFKMIRAALRLSRANLGELTFALENTWYRDTGRRLSSVRDAVAMLECMAALEKRWGRDLDPAVAESVRRGLERRLAAVSADEEGLVKRSAEVSAGLQAALGRVKDWGLHDRGFKTIGPGLERTYRRGRRAMRVALAEPSDENLHEWRKRAKDHWYHVRLLRNVWPKVMDAYRREMRNLTEALGMDHDLALLLPLVRDDPGSFGGDDGARVFVELIHRRRAELQDQARVVGKRIYAEKPRTLVQRFKARW
jgi:CHAD domain-containing protein